jgi:hypothetical protein
MQVGYWIRKDLTARVKQFQHKILNSTNALLLLVYYIFLGIVALGGLVVSVLATGPKVHWFDPDLGRWIF